jgi:NosR/NirI family nitrous oxide reductase transcriptional regulator
MPFDHRKKPQQRLERTLAIVALGIIGIAWFLGTFRDESTLPKFLNQALPEANHFEHTGGEAYSAWKDQDKEQLMGYVTVGSAHGYGGEIRVAVAVSIDGSVKGLTIIDHKETTSFLRRVLKRDFLKMLQGKIYSDPFTVGEDVDNVTGATVTSRAIADAVRKASRRVASRDLGFSVIPERPPPIQFGLPESVLIALFAVGVVGRWDRFKYRKTARWASMLTGLFVLGFVYNKPLTLTIINKMLLGFWPEWQLHLYWYLLLAGILFVFTADDKNPYCEWFCPFGAAQECLGIIGGAKGRTPQRYHNLLRWFQRALALSAIIIALLYRNPSISCYEVFGAFFRLIGSNFHFVLLGVVLIAALFLKRPWCRYLCPLRPVTDFIRLIRNWMKELCLKLRSNPSIEVLEIERESKNRSL